MPISALYHSAWWVLRDPFFEGRGGTLPWVLLLCTCLLVSPGPTSSCPSSVVRRPPPPRSHLSCGAWPRVGPQAEVATRWAWRQLLEPCQDMPPAELIKAQAVPSQVQLPGTYTWPGSPGGSLTFPSMTVAWGPSSQTLPDPSRLQQEPRTHCDLVSSWWPVQVTPLAKVPSPFPPPHLPWWPPWVPGYGGQTVHPQLSEQGPMVGQAGWLGGLWIGC